MRSLPLAATVAPPRRCPFFVGADGAGASSRSGSCVPGPLAVGLFGLVASGTTFVFGKFPHVGALALYTRLIGVPGMRHWFVRGRYTPEQMRAIASLRDPTRRRVYEAVVANPGTSPGDVSASVGAPLPRCSRSARALERAGLIERRATGRALSNSPSMPHPHEPRHVVERAVVRHERFAEVEGRGRDLEVVPAQRSAFAAELVLEARGLVAIVGKEALSERDVKFLEFADLFEDQFVRQGRDEDRAIEGTLDLAWKLLGHIPTTQLTRLDRKLIDEYYPKEAMQKHGAPVAKK